jgi:hypothetical protein
MTRTFCVAIGIGLLSVASASASEIREFDIPTLEKLGRELSRRDQMAARASDLVLAKHPELKTGPLLEWVTDLSNGRSVYWIVDTEPQPTPVYRVVGDRIEDIHGKALPPAIQRRYNARRSAIKAVLPKLNRAYGATYNFEVLDDPDGSGFLVYALAAFTRSNPIYIGGHFRVTVSADGSKVERIDDLSHGIIENKTPPGAKSVALGTAQALDAKYPVETFIYSSNLYHIPIGVGTKDGTIWMVVNGKITKMDPNLVKQVEAESKKNKGKK